MRLTEKLEELEELGGKGRLPSATARELEKDGLVRILKIEKKEALVELTPLGLFIPYAISYIDNTDWDFDPDSLEDEQLNPERYYITLWDAVFDGFCQVYEDIDLSEEEKETAKAFVYRYASKQAR